LPFKQFFLYMQMEEPLVLFVTQVMVFPTLSQFLKVSKFHMPSNQTTLLEEPLLIILTSFLLLMVLQSKVENLPGHKLLEKSRKKNALLPSISQRQQKRQITQMSIPKITNFQMDKLLRLINQDLWDQKLYSSQNKLSKDQKF